PLEIYSEEMLPQTEKCTKDLSAAPIAKNPTPNVYYCKWQSEEEGDMKAYVVGGTIFTRRGRSKHKPESSLDELNYVPKIRRVVNLVELMGINTQPIEEESLSLAIYMTTLEKIPTHNEDHDEY
ncbi:298_t:CDS:2, partial [Acaulospora morrowiae]